jgi:GT2 family glycosyltransferase
VNNCMAGNLSVRRTTALAVGGMDENFVGVAYRFETEFCRRLGRSGCRVVFDGGASIRHLQAAHGGTRTHGVPMCSASPRHGVGDYYFALREGDRVAEVLSYFLLRMAKTLGSRFYLRHPWCLPVKLIGELRAMALAIRLRRRPPQLLPRSRAHSSDG